jgi:hypothetical protein
MNPRNFTATQSTILHNEYPLAHNPDPASIPAMTWSTNYGRLAPQTLFTLFFAGRDFAPNCIIDGSNIQDYLQSHYIEAFGQLADRIRDAGDLLDDCVIGWDSYERAIRRLGWVSGLALVAHESGFDAQEGTHANAGTVIAPRNGTSSDGRELDVRRIWSATCGIGDDRP